MSKITYTSTRAKNRFGEVLDHVRRGDQAVVTVRGEPVAVVLSIEEYRSLGGGLREVDGLDAELEALYASFQTRHFARASELIFEGDPEDIAVAAAPIPPDYDT